MYSAEVEILQALLDAHSRRYLFCNPSHELAFQIDSGSTINIIRGRTHGILARGDPIESLPAGSGQFLVHDVGHTDHQM